METADQEIRHGADPEGGISRPRGPSFEPFSSPFWARGAHLQTILGHALNRISEPLDSARLAVDLPDGDRLVLMVDPPPESSRGVALLMHGLGGDAGARYMLSVATRLRERGMVTYRLNHRAAGAGGGVSRRTYHSGLTEDVEAAVKAVTARHAGLPLVLVGFSMSGNLLLKYLGERGNADGVAGIAVSPPVDLAACVAALERPVNRIYHRRFARLLTDTLRNNARLAETPPLFTASRARSVRQYDTEVTAPTWGFDSAEQYYDSQSARRVVRYIEIPTTVITADDDPFIPTATFEGVDWPSAVTFHLTRGGGHMGYIGGRRTPFGDRRWLDYAVTCVADELVASVS